MAAAPLNLEASRASLNAERERLLLELGQPIENPTQMTYGSQAAAASQVFEQQRDLALRDRSRLELSRGRGGAPLDRRWHVRDLHELRQPDRRRAAGGHPVGADVHRLRPQAGAMTTEAKRGGAEADTRARGRRLGDSSPEAPLVSIEDVRRAAANLAGVAIRSPLLPFGTAGEGGPRVLLKAESLQPIGAFKIRAPITQSLA